MRRQRAMTGRAAAIIGGCVIGVACSGSATPTAPTAVNPLNLSVSISQNVIAVGQAAMVTFKLENTGGENLTLKFPSSCQIRAYVIDSRANHVMYPRGGEWACAAAMSDMPLPPFSAAMQQVQIVAMLNSVTPPGSQVIGLAPGEYGAYAIVEDVRDTIRSATVRFTVEGQ